MTRKDYVKLAAALAAVPQFSTHIATDAGQLKVAALTFREAALNVADVLQNDNPRFNRKRFLEAAGALDAQVQQV